MGFNFTKISIEKKSDRPKEFKVNRNINVETIAPAKSNILKMKEEVLAIKFNYSILYDPNYASIDLDGSIVIGLDPKLAKDVLKMWKDKKMPEEFQLSLFNTILMKSDVKALELEDDLGLPYHVPLPTLRPSNKESKK